MSRITTLLFPDTTLDLKITLQLLLFFEKIFYYQPAEPEEATEPDRNSINSLFTEKGLCRGYTPIPLGENLEQFYQTLKDLQVHLDDYGNRLPYLSLASLSSGQPVDEAEASIDNLVSELRKNHASKDRDDSDNITNRVALWQARLVLKLAELLDQEEMEIEQGLANIASRERDMFKSLKGPEGENGLEKFHLPNSEKISPSHSSTLEQRIKAWVQLFLAEQQANHIQKQHWLLTTSREEAITMFFETYTGLFKKQPTLLFSIPIPSLDGSDINDIMGGRVPFRAQTSKPLATFEEFLTKIASGKKQCPHNDSGADFLHQEVAEWTEAIRQCFPSAGSAESWLTFYCFPATSLSNLLARSSHIAVAGKYPPTAYPNGLIAVLTAGPSYLTLNPYKG